MNNIENLAKRLEEARKLADLSLMEASEKLSITSNLLSDWECGLHYPDFHALVRVAELYHVTTDWLLSGELPSKELLEVATSAKTSFFNDGKMHTYIGAYCNAKEMYQTMRALSFAREKHMGQFRKGTDGKPVPYIYHPLLMTCQALSLGFMEDDLLSACLLHDVCEDCGVPVEELPVSDTCREAVRILTKPDDFEKTEENTREYYKGIMENRIASIVKIMDRCQNISGMASCFDDEHMARYIIETENHVFPLIRNTRTVYPQYDNQMFLLKYHMTSVTETIKHFLKHKNEV